jgi:hypothetical protein
LLLLPLACARLALRLALLLRVRPRPASSASAFASSASRSAELEDISTDRPPEHEARSAATSCAPALAQATRLRPQAGGRQAAGLARRPARRAPRSPRDRAPSGAPTGSAPPALREKTPPARRRLYYYNYYYYHLLGNFRLPRTSASSRASLHQEVPCDQEPVSDPERQVISRTALS